MAEPSVAFVTVATPGYYQQCARSLGKSLFEHCDYQSLRFHILDGVEGEWPTGTITRPAVIMENWDGIWCAGADYVFCIDADMRVDGQLDIPAMLGEIVATEHPGYVGHHPTTLPYDRNFDSRAYIKMGQGERYYCGGFFGGDTDSIQDLLWEMVWICERDAPTPRFHDESALNKALLQSPPTLILSPAYCHPDNDAYYREQVWQEDYPRIIVALDKPESERGDR